MQSVKPCRSSAVLGKPCKLRIRAGSAVRALAALSTMLAFLLTSAQVEPGSVSDWAGGDALSAVGEEQKEDLRARPAPEVHVDPTPTHGLTQSIDLDLRTDPRQVCEIQGPVDWEPGKLTLGTAGSIRRAVEVGDEAKLTLRLVFAPLSEDGQSSTTRFGFQIRDRGAYFVHIIRRREGGKFLSQIHLVDQNGPSRGRQTRRTRTLRTFEWDGDFPDEVWTFRLHHGLQTVHLGSKCLAIGHAYKSLDFGLRDSMSVGNFDRQYLLTYGITSPLEVSGWVIKHDGPALGCTRVAGSASPREKVPFVIPPNPIIPWEFSVSGGPPTPLHEMIDHPLETVQPETRAQLSGPFSKRKDRSVPFYRIRTDLGERHPYHALSLAGWGMQYHWAGKDAPSEKFLLQAVELSEKSLGPLHPDHALILSSLGQVYREMGKFEQAEPLLRQALAADTEVFGSGSHQHNQALRHLALLNQDRARFADAETLFAPTS